MVAALAITPASGSITAKKTVCRINVTGATANDATAYSSSVYPTEPAIKYYLLMDAPVGTDDKRSYVFTPATGGTHEFNNFMFDVAGSWTVRLRKSSDDSDAATLSVTVS